MDCLHLDLNGLAICNLCSTVVRLGGPCLRCAKDKHAQPFKNVIEILMECSLKIE